MNFFLSSNIKSLMNEVDDVTKGYKEYSFIITIRQKLLNSLKAVEKQDKNKFNEFVSTTNKRFWALAQTSGLAFDLVATGQYHLMNSLNMEGMQLQSFYFKCLETALEEKFIDKETFDKQQTNFRKQVYETGQWA